MSAASDTDGVIGSTARTMDHQLRGESGSFEALFLREHPPTGAAAAEKITL
jgi:hypothetical protein